MSNYAKRAGWTYIGFAKAADLLVVHLTSWRASRPARVERANQRVVLSDKGVVSGIIMPFQFGTNWSRFTDATADVLSPHDTMSYRPPRCFDAQVESARGLRPLSIRGLVLLIDLRTLFLF